MAARPSTSRMRRAGKSLRLVSQAKGKPIKLAKSVVAAASAMLLPMMTRVRPRSRYSRPSWPAPSAPVMR